MGKIENRNGHQFYAEGERAVLGQKGSVSVIIDGDQLMRPIVDKLIAAVGGILRGVWPVGLEVVLIEDAPGATKIVEVTPVPADDVPVVPVAASAGKPIRIKSARRTLVQATEGVV